ncbi:MAG: UPF0175 family protein [Pyrinomonadaceae bacterium]
MTNIAIELPEEIAGRLGEQENLSRFTLEAVVAQGYRNGKLTHAEVQRMLGFASRWETDAFLKEAGAYLDYTEADLEHDLEISRRITGR